MNMSFQPWINIALAVKFRRENSSADETLTEKEDFFRLFDLIGLPSLFAFLVHRIAQIMVYPLSLCPEMAITVDVTCICDSIKLILKHEYSSLLNYTCWKNNHIYSILVTCSHFYASVRVKCSSLPSNAQDKKLMVLYNNSERTYWNAGNPYLSKPRKEK